MATPVWVPLEFTEFTIDDYKMPIDIVMLMVVLLSLPLAIVETWIIYWSTDS